MTTRHQGDLGEVSALDWLMRLGAHVFVPVGHSPNCDLVAELDGSLLRIQVKTSRRPGRNGAGSYQVQLSTRGGNQSWGGTSKVFDTSRCDFLFVVVGDGRRWLIPAAEITAKHAITVGGEAWRRFEVERGPALLVAAEGV
ncbi:MAG: hypothetical protein LC808_20570 [Actinobacteria bacterium]|nr:hypothetical protein [Actinomycetota bacterium]